jgi:hypothetical protein
VVTHVYKPHDSNLARRPLVHAGENAGPATAMPRQSRQKTGMDICRDARHSRFSRLSHLAAIEMGQRVFPVILRRARTADNSSAAAPVLTRRHSVARFLLRPMLFERPGISIRRNSYSSLSGIGVEHALHRPNYIMRNVPFSAINQEPAGLNKGFSGAQIGGEARPGYSVIA